MYELKILQSIGCGFNLKWVVGATKGVTDKGVTVLSGRVSFGYSTLASEEKASEK